MPSAVPTPDAGTPLLSVVVLVQSAARAWNRTSGGGPFCATGACSTVSSAILVITSGYSRYFSVTLEGRVRLLDLGTHLYLLIPLLDDEHCWVGDANVHFASLPASTFRDHDHRFEWTRAEFEAWATAMCNRFGYHVRLIPVGDLDVAVGAPNQMGVFEQ
ncbi:hypothetical protein [Corallococcus sp. CA053C]|uniref:hypothetical protein n=1 Tax=Corallococcus sp. CA053C TaxID=2316732 RepID=UPI002104BA1F|nr:hypothetical protein [Corallococcus sp. CA053C]